MSLKTRKSKNGSLSKDEVAGPTINDSDLELVRLKIAEIESSGKIEALESEIKRLRSADPVESRRKLLSDLTQKRRRVPIKDLPAAITTQNTIMTKLFCDEYLRNAQNDTDERDAIFQEQTGLELNILENLMELPKEQFDDLFKNFTRTTEGIIACDLDPALEPIADCRHRLSFWMPERAFKIFLKEHIAELQDLLEIYKSKAESSADSGGSRLHLHLSAYESGLLAHDPLGPQSYLNVREDSIEIQKRLLCRIRSSTKPTVWDGFVDFEWSHLFASVEDVARAVLIRSSTINSVIFAPLPESKEPDHFTFYTLESVSLKSRKWKLDPYAQNLTRAFTEKYMERAAAVWKQFYHDAFGHNDYIPGFEHELDQRLDLARWRQMRMLWENIQIVCDEKMMGLIMRKVLCQSAKMWPNKEIDLLQSTTVAINSATEIAEERRRINRGLPATESEPEDYFYKCFTRFNKWKSAMTRSAFESRWATFLSK